MSLERRSVRLLVADPREIVRGALGEVLDRKGFRVIAGVATVKEMLETGRLERPDVVIMNAALGDGPYGLATLVRLQAAASAVIVTGVDDHSDGPAEVVAAGAKACLSERCSFDHLLEALFLVVDGGTVVLSGRAEPRRAELGRDTRMSRLTRRERDVLSLLAEGKDSLAISEDLVISRQTARTHIQRVLAKLEVHSQLEATALVYRSRRESDFEGLGA